MGLPASFHDSRVCILGLGYVGLTLAVAMADVGFQVHGIETRQSVLDLLLQGKPHFWEPRLEQKLGRVTKAGRLTFSQSPPPDLKASVFVITVGTPLDKSGNARLDMVSRATRELTSIMPDNALVVLRSTVKLGTARNVVKPILEATGRPYMLAMCPERTLEGRALIELFELPQIVGADDAETRSRCQQLFGKLTPTTIAMSSLEAAEMVKLVDNTYRDVSFAFANEIAALCGHMGLSAHEVIRAGKLGYTRTNVPSPGPVGGPCLEKDPHILVESAKSYGVEMAITSASRRVNETQPLETIALLKQKTDRIAGFPKAPKIALLGLAFKGKPATDDLRGTMALPILVALRAHYPGAAITVHDPVAAKAEAEAIFGAPFTNSLDASLAGTDLAVIANNHDSFQSSDLQDMLAKMNNPSVIYDYWNLHTERNWVNDDGKFYIALGSERLIQ